ncbi:MAG: response regulator [Deltaproteobacteria bacterium]|nr:response regulator [Deltaproteobacteria bacterium]
MNEKKILIVDDEAPIRDVLSLYFTKHGYSVRSAEDALQTLDILKTDRCQVMLLDLNMPGMDGLELCRKIRPAFPFAYIFAITGQSSLFELADCREAGFDDYFIKPFDFAQLLNAVEYAFGRMDRWKRKQPVQSQQPGPVEPDLSD